MKPPTPKTSKLPWIVYIAWAILFFRIILYQKHLSSAYENVLETHQQTWELIVSICQHNRGICQEAISATIPKLNELRS